MPRFALHGEPAFNGGYRPKADMQATNRRGVGGKFLRPGRRVNISNADEICHPQSMGI
ncbi:MAG TPA: hypothetical protein VIW72_10040 [Burkholderiales bacterium]